MTHNDILKMERHGNIGECVSIYDKPINCIICGCVCKHNICNTCVDEAIDNDEIRMAYINNSQASVYDWLNYTDAYWNNKDMPDKNDIDTLSKMAGISKEVFKTVTTEDVYCAVASYSWINQDRLHFVEWLVGRDK